MGTERWYASAGAVTKIATLGLSVGGRYGRIGDSGVDSAALGFQYGIARSPSVNLGVNQSMADTSGEELRPVDSEERNRRFDAVQFLNRPAVVQPMVFH